MRLCSTPLYQILTFTLLITSTAARAPAYTLSFAPSCKNWKPFGDVRPILEDAFTVSKLMAQVAHLRLDYLLNGPQGVLQGFEERRIERLLTAFFVPPNRPGYVDTARELLKILGVLMNADAKGMPTMWCGLPTVVSQAQAGRWKWDQKKLAGKLVNCTEYRDEPAGPVTIGTANRPSFFLISTFVISKK